jgi:amidophosphoribosyltransferase
VNAFDTSCFSGEYVTGDVTPEYLVRLQADRSDSAKAARRLDEVAGAAGTAGGPKALRVV